jgi:hypothetical protein
MHVCAVLNCRRTGVTTLQVTTTNGSIRCENEFRKGGRPMFSIIFPHREHRYTGAMKKHLSPADYVMARFLMPEKIGRNYITAPARYSETQIIDSHMETICYR